ncbi:adhesion G-protein coupled receptor G6-like [Anneissia japonica]|uniref:adhesion G-protein coupled receptor G6-like n=1 Tax=Anneissia japonica TaxID=1529436 RepID=UPI001425B8A1|nr:adhesion G-protein coupled receptor G6-like [Anneissia japonica]
MCTGESVTQNGISYSFQDVLLHTIAESTQQCPLYSNEGNMVPLATRYCGGDYISGAKWDAFNVSDCDIGTSSTQIRRIKEINVIKDNVVDVADALAKVTNNTGDLDEYLIMNVLDILEDIVGLKMPNKSVTFDVVTVVNNVIDSGVLGKNQSMKGTASSFVKSLEQQLECVAAAGINFTVVLTHVSIMTLSTSSRALDNGLTYVAFSDGDSLSENFEADIVTLSEKPFPIDMVGASISLPPEITSSQSPTKEDEIGLYFTVYQNNSLFISNKLANESGKELKRKVSGHVISASVERVKVDGLVHPIKVTFLSSFEIVNTECVFWNFSLDNGVGEWSNDGCTLNRTEDDSAICFCDHLTNFAILIDYYQPKESQFQDVLSVISLIGCIVSIFCLTITIANYLYLKKIRCKIPQKIHINLSISLLLLYLVFVTGIKKTSSETGCIIVATLIHYFGLSSVFWMSIEAMNMYLMFVKIHYAEIRYFMLKIYVVGYGFPLVIVAICLAIDVDNYADEKYCFISSGNLRNFGFIFVVGLLLLFNCVVFVLVMRRLTCGRNIMNVDESKRKLVIKRHLQNGIAISVLLGLTWVFGFMAIDSNSSTREIFQALFCIFNSLQGFFIFLFFCVRQKHIRDEWKEYCCACCAGSRRQTYNVQLLEKVNGMIPSADFTNYSAQSPTKTNIREDKC